MAEDDAIRPESPVSEPTASKLQDGIALCLSGGGYRAMLFHVGSLWRLNEAGLLAKLNRISSVSGGSITAGQLGAAWSRLAFDAGGVAQSFEQELVQPIRALAARTIDQRAIWGGLFSSGSIADKVAAAYDRYLFGGTTLQDLPNEPRFVINATNVQSGALWRFSRSYMGDYLVGRVMKPTLSLATAVAASSAFPPVLSPMTLDLDPSDFAKPEPGDPPLAMGQPAFQDKVMLTDGGVYDNLGLETAWKRYRTILISDGGGKIAPEAVPDTDWARHAVRVNEIIDNQVRSLRKRQAIGGFVRGDRLGTYWGVRTNIADYQLAGGCTVAHSESLALANLPTRLKATPDKLQERLISWGFAVCDAALRRHYDPALAPRPLPYAIPNWDASAGV
jgi:NTE family protein